MLPRDVLDAVESNLDAADAALLRQDWQGVADHTAAVLKLEPQHALAKQLNDLAAGRITAYGEIATRSGHVAGERRYLTVMFCDLVNSTSMSERLDPEDVRAVLLRYHAACADIVRRHQGHIARIVGDGLLIYFGYPRGQEDAAYRAVLAGIEITDSMRDIALDAHSAEGEMLQVRVGIHAGLAVMSDMGSGEWRNTDDAVGLVPNLAARLHALAEPGAVVISSAVLELVRGRIEVHSLGSPELRGVSAPLECFRAIRPTNAETRFRAMSGARSQFVSRATELAQLQALLDQPNREGQLAIVSGEAGIGKSRLVEEFGLLARKSGFLCVEGYCSERMMSTPFYPLFHVVDELIGVESWDEPSIYVAKLEQALGEADPELVNTTPLLAQLVNRSVDGLKVPVDTPQQTRLQAMRAFRSWLAAISRSKPVLLVVEDIHWIDPSTFEFLQELASDIPNGLIMTLTTRGPDSVLTRAHPLELRLARLTEQDCVQLVRGMPGGDTIPEESAALIALRGDGVPLFVEECTRMLAGANPAASSLRNPADGSVPATLQELLLSRLDGLGAGKGLAQVAATIGRETAHDLLETSFGGTGSDFETALSDLLESELIETSGAAEYRVYRFRHTLFQETAYLSQLMSRRREVHQDVAKALQGQFSTVVNAEPHVLAYHLEGAGDHAASARQWQAAGEKAAAVGAHAEAAEHFQHGIDLLRRELAEGPGRDVLELPLELFLGASLASGQGYGFPAVAQAFGRAYEICVGLGQPVDLVPALHGLWTYYITRAEFSRANEIADTCLRLAEESGRVDLLILTDAMVGGRFATAPDGPTVRATLRHLDNAIDTYERLQLIRPRVQLVHPRVKSLHPMVQALLVSSLQLWHSGYPETAEANGNRAIAFAATQSDDLALVSKVYALTYRAFLNVHSADADVTLRSAQEAAAFAGQHGFAVFLAASGVFAGWAHSMLGRRDEGLAQLDAAIEGYRRTGAEVYVAEFLGLRAAAEAAAGRTNDAMDTVDVALMLAETSGDIVPQAELHRVRGEILLANDASAWREASAEYMRALDIAHEREERSDELRAAMSMYERSRRKGNAEPERKMLSALLGQFTEGFDSPDHRRARALLGT